MELPQGSPDFQSRDSFQLYSHLNHLSHRAAAGPGFWREREGSVCVGVMDDKQPARQAKAAVGTAVSWALPFDG